MVGVKITLCEESPVDRYARKREEFPTEIPVERRVLSRHEKYRSETERGYEHGETEKDDN